MFRKVKSHDPIVFICLVFVLQAFADRGIVLALFGGA